MRKSTLYMTAALGLLFAFSQALRGGTHDKELQPSFQTSDRCFACHNGMTTSCGQRLLPWTGVASQRDGQLRARSVLAGERAARNHRPSGVESRHRRRMFDLPHAHRALRSQAARSDWGKCSRTCRSIPRRNTDAQAEDGVTCSVCHQISAKGLGTPASYVGNFVIDPPLARGNHPEYGPYVIEPGQMHAMSTSTGGFDPTHGSSHR